ncbi:MAG: hypothetical protein SFU25_06500 [Candidatus Caenarcaniphilales bacterium]|nr:hypothetical protein [Candidatus Caenarcaniphilales bacterium]
MTEKEENREIRRKIDEGVRAAIAEAVKNNNDLWIRPSDYGGASPIYQPNDTDILIDNVETVYRANPDLEEYVDKARKFQDVAIFNLSLALRRRKEFLSFFGETSLLNAPIRQITFDEFLNNSEEMKFQMNTTSKFNSCFLLGFISLESYIEYISSRLLSHKLEQIVLFKRKNLGSKNLEKDLFNDKERKAFFQKDKLVVSNQNISMIEKLKLLVEISFKTFCVQFDDKNKKELNEKLENLQKLIKIRHCLTHSRARPQEGGIELFTFADKASIIGIDNFYRWLINFLWPLEFMRPIIDLNGKTRVEIPLSFFLEI